MNLINIGKIVNTHGIKGELRIISHFRHKNLVFKKDMKFYINKKEYVVNSYRHHKIFDMVTFVGFNNINDVEFLKGSKVFVNEEDIKLEDNKLFSFKLIGFSVIIDGNSIGEVSEILDTPANEVIRAGKYLIPYVDEFIEKIDEKDKKLYIKNMKGLL